MKYKLIYTHRAVKDIKRLDPRCKQQLNKALVRYAQDPLEHAKKLTDARLGAYRFRIGDYRVIFDLMGDEIVILRVGHRGNIYKSR